MKPTRMDEAAYLNDRLDDQYRWYDAKSSFNQQRYKLIRTTVIVLSISIPLLAGLVDTFTWIKYVIGIAGALVAILESLQSLHKYQENWTQYRLTAEALQREKLFYLTQSGLYAESAHPFQDLVLNVEQITAGENQNWKKIMQENKEEGQEKS